VESAIMEDFYEIREKRNITSSLIIIELLKGKRKLREIATALKITPQGASIYLKNLEKQGYVNNTGSPTPKGVAFLQQMLATMTMFVEDAYEDTGIISTCEAVASEDLKKNDKVSLSMSKGLLFASKKAKTGSNGIAEFDVKKGNPVKIMKIKGIVDHKVGNFFVIAVDFSDYTPRKFEKLNKILKEKEIEYVGAFGILASEICKSADIKAVPYAPVEGCIEAGAKGVNSLLIYSPEMARFFFQKLSANIHKYRINPKFVEL
jgi:putative transcriptional regulator